MSDVVKELQAVLADERRTSQECCDRRVHQARLDEREACARIAEDWCANHAAIEIRNRR